MAHAATSAAYTSPDINPVDISQIGASLILTVIGTPVTTAALFGTVLAYSGVQGWGLYSEDVATRTEYEGDVASHRASTRIT